MDGVWSAARGGWDVGGPFDTSRKPTDPRTGTEPAASRPSAVVIWGVGGYTQQYIACLRQAGIDVAVCVDQQLAGTEYDGVKVIAPNACVRQCYLYPGLPVVVTARGPTGEDCFADAVLHLANEFDVPSRLLHPAFLADRLRLDYSGHVLLLGFPGAGSIAFEQVITPLLDRQPVHHGPAEKLFAGLAREYHANALLPTVDHLFTLGGRYASVESTVRGDQIRIDMQLSHERFATVWGLRSKRRLYQRLHPSHEPLTDETFRSCRSMNRTILVAVRHPMDIIVSSAARLYRSPRRILANLEWFRAMAVLVKEYYEGILARHNGVTLLRYEDLLSHPADTIRSVGRAMNIDVDHQDAAAVWERAAARAASSVVASGDDGTWPTRPGTWREFCCDRHVRIVAQLGYGPFLGALGYDETLPTGSGSNAPEGDDEPALRGRERRDAAHVDLGYHVLYDKPLHFRHETFCDDRDPTSDFRMVTNDAQLWNLVRLGLSSRYVRTLLRALEP